MSVNLMSAIFETEFRDLIDGNGNVTKASTAKLVLLAMADHANDEGEGAYPSVERLVRKTALSAQTIRNTFDALRYNGVIELEGVSKWGTNNHTINTKCFPKAIGKEVTVLTLYPLDPSNEYRDPLKSVPLTPLAVIPESSLSINKTSDATFSKTDLAEIEQAANKTVDAMLEFERKAQERETAGTAWRGREITPPNYLIYADWWHAKTGLHMYGAKAKAKIDPEWLKACQGLYENEVTLAACDEAFAAESWGNRKLSRLSQIVATAKAIQAAPKRTDKPAELVRSSMIRTIGQ